MFGMKKHGDRQETGITADENATANKGDSGRVRKNRSPDEIIDETIRNGGMLAALYFDVHGKTSDSVRNIMVDFVSRLTKEPGVVFAYGEIDAPIEMDNGVYSTSVEVRALTKDMRTLAALCLKYIPAGVEILRPHQLKMDIGEMQSILLDLASYAFNMTQLLLSKGLTDAQKAELARRLKKREEIGKGLLEKNKGKRCKDDRSKDDN